MCGSRILFLAALIGSSRAQSGVDKAGLAGLLTVCGGTVVIVGIIWFAVCYGHYKVERDFCEFRKRLRQRREQYRRYRERLAQRQQRQRRRRGRAQLGPRNVHISSPIPRVREDGVRPPLLQTQPPASGSVSPSQPQSQLLPISTPATALPLSIVERDAHTQLHPSLRPAEDAIPTEPHGVAASADTTSNPVRGKSSEPGGNGKNGEKRKTVHFMSQEGTTAGNVTDTNQTQPQYQTQSTTGLGHHDNQTPNHSHDTRLRAVLGHYSPKSLREEEEVDIRLDEGSSPPRYSWVFPDKRFPQREGVRSKLPEGRGGGDGRRAGGMRDRERGDMAAYGQLQTWPQLSL